MDAQADNISLKVQLVQSKRETEAVRKAKRVLAENLKSEQETAIGL